MSKPITERNTNMKTRGQISTALLGLALLCSLSFSVTLRAQPIAGTNEIAYADFDNFIPGWSYGYFYPGDQGATFIVDRFYYDPSIEPENGPTVLQYTFDNSPFELLVAGNPGYSYGTGFGMPVNWDFDWTKFTSTELADYILSWDARVEGLLPGQTTANCQMEFRLNSSLVDPPLPNNRALQRNIAYNPGSNWTHFVFTLDTGSWGDNTTYNSFTNGIAAGITGIEFNQNQHRPDGQFGFGPNKVIYLDNIKLEVISYAGPPPPPPPKQALSIFDYNFDDKALWYSWNAFPGGTGWVDGGGTRAYYWAENNVAGAGVGGSQAFIMGMDNTLMAQGTRPGWAGGNVGGGGPVDYSSVTSADLKDYRLNFAARVEGLAPGRESTPVTVQLHFLAPDDTLQPPDGDTNRDLLLRLNVDVSGLTSEWKTFTPLLKEGSVNAGTLANFQDHFNKIDEISFQFQILNSHQDEVWGYDADNRIVVDDFKLERLVAATPPLNVQLVGGNVVVSWPPVETGTVQLQSASNVNGPYTEVVGASSPYSTPIAGAPKYFRTIWVPPAP